MSDDAWDAFSRRLFDQNAFAIKLGLDNIRRAFALQGHPERCAPAIVVGGTNGKGSVAATTAAILQAHGLRVGLFTSPHLLEFRERFRIDGVPVDRDTVLAVGRQVLDAYGGADADPCLTFFELGTLMAALIFADADVDVVVWEVGLGGRLDAVNAIEPALTVVTNIDLDHQAYLGDTIAAVATEKAALRRPSIPLILAPQTHAAAIPHFESPTTVMLAHEPNVPGRLDWAAGSVVNQSTTENRRTAFEAARQFLGVRWEPARADEGLARARWPGRLDLRTAHGARFLLDAAHNPAGTTRLYDLLRPDPPAAVVVGAMADKDLAAMFGPLAELGAPVYLASVASKRAASIDALRASVRGAAIAGVGDSHDLFDAAARVDGYVAVFGSVYLLGEWFHWAHCDATDMVTWQ